MKILSGYLSIAVFSAVMSTYYARYSTWPGKQRFSSTFVRSANRTSSTIELIEHDCERKELISEDGVVIHVSIHNAPLPEAFPSNGFVGLQSIVIHNPNFDEVNKDLTICKYLMSNSSALKLLSLHNHAHTDRYPAKVFIDNLGYCKNLETLDLALMYLKSREISAVVQALPNLIFLSTIVFDSNHLPPDIVSALITRLKRSPSIQHVSLSGCKLIDDCMDDFARLLKTNRNITSLDLSCNDITLGGLKKLFDHIRYSFQTFELQLLDLSYNNLGEEGMNYIGSLFSTGCLNKIKHLILREVGAGPLSIEKLFHAVSSKSAIETVDLSGNCVLRKKSKESSVIGKQLVNPVTKSLFSAVQSVSGTFLGIQSQLTAEISSPTASSSLIQLTTKAKRRYRASIHKKSRKSRIGTRPISDDSSTLKQPVIVDMRESERKEFAVKLELGEFLHVAKAMRDATRKAKHLRVIRLLKTGLSSAAIEQLQTTLTSLKDVQQNGSNNRMKKGKKVLKVEQQQDQDLSYPSGDSTDTSSPKECGTVASSGKVGRTVVVDVALNAVDGPKRLIEVSL